MLGTGQYLNVSLNLKKSPRAKLFAFCPEQTGKLECREPNKKFRASNFVPECRLTFPFLPLSCTRYKNTHDPGYGRAILAQGMLNPLEWECWLDMFLLTQIKTPMDVIFREHNTHWFGGAPIPKACFQILGLRAFGSPCRAICEQSAILPLLQHSLHFFACWFLKLMFIASSRPICRSKHTTLQSKCGQPIVPFNQAWTKWCTVGVIYTNYAR